MMLYTKYTYGRNTFGAKVLLFICVPVILPSHTIIKCHLCGDSF
jgi:hypothetical protein